MYWISLVLTVHGLSAALLLALLISVVRESRPTVAHRAFAGLLAGSLGWLLVNGISEWLTVYARPDGISLNTSNAVGALAGLAIQTMTLATFVLCESLPARPTFDAWSQNGKRDPRRPLIRIAIVAAGCLVLAALSFSPDWITDRRLLPDGSTTADYGPFFRYTGIWSTAVVGWGLFLLYGKYARESDPRLRQQIALFWIGIGLSLAVGIVFSFLLPLAGNSRLFFVGVDSSIVLVTLVAYAVLFRGLFDLRSALLRITFRFVVAATLAIGIYTAFLVFLLNRNISDFSAELALALCAFFLIVFVFAQHVLPAADRLFVRRPPPLQNVVPGLFRSLEIDEREISVESDDLSQVVQALDAALPTRRSLVLTADAKGLRIHRRENDITLAADTMRLLRRLLNVRQLPRRIFQAWDRTYLLEELPESLPGDIAPRYARITRLLREAFAALARAGFRIILPLLHGQRFAGFVALGEKRDDFPFYDRDLVYLDALRLALGVLFQHRRVLQTIRHDAIDAGEDLRRMARVLREQEAHESQEENLPDRTIVYRSAAMRSIMKQAERIAASDVPVLITGETGTGKEVLARTIHHRSERFQFPFVAVNCAAIAANLWEDELFGHVAGAFTDARGERAGRIREAGSGVLFLDEIGELPLEMQAKLLRLLQENVFSPVGSDGTAPARCRFIFATNRNLPQDIQAGRFREDLYYRINVLALEAPPLRDRPEDVVPLFQHHLAQACARARRSEPALDPGAANVLLRYPWPGNIRELENLAIRLGALHEGELLRAGDLPATIRQAPRVGPRVLVTKHNISDADLTLREMVDDYTRRIIVETLKKTEGNRTKAAQLLGVKRGSLLYRMKELGIE